jgi:DNA polymerase V
MSTQLYGLCDCNNFYASCERVFRPDLAHQPVIVLSNNDGCVIARSNEVKKLGIPMAAPIHEWQAYVEEYHIQLFSANFALYGNLSSRVMETLGRFTNSLEIYSMLTGSTG